MRSFKRLVSIVVTLMLAILGGEVFVPAARAEQAYPIAFTNGIGIYPRTAPSMDAARNGSALPEGTMVTIECELEGQPVSNDMATISIWAKTSHGYLPNAYIHTGVDSWTPGVARCESSDPESSNIPDDHWSKNGDRKAQRYWRDKATDYAQRHFQDPHEFDNNCTAFVSKALWAGDMPKHQDWTNESLLNPFHRGFTEHARVTDKLVGHLTYYRMAEVREISLEDPLAGNAMPGDIIAYDFKSREGPQFDHLAIVTGLTAGGQSLITQQTNNRKDIPWNGGKRGIRRAYLVHITY